MGSEFLSIYRENAVDLLQEALPFVLSGEIGYAALLDVCGHYRVKAAVHMLLDADSRRFHVDLSKSARTFLFGLDRIPVEEVVVSRALPFFDALACRDMDTAKAIAERFPDHPDPKREYEEDFTFVTYLARRVRGNISPEEADDLLDGWMSAAEGVPGVRYEVCAGLAHGDARSFASAFAGYLDEYRERYALGLERGQIPEDLGNTVGNLCIEGLALLRLAEDSGLPTEREYDLIPSLVRPVPEGPYAAEGWRDPADEGI